MLPQASFSRSKLINLEKEMQQPPHSSRNFKAPGQRSALEEELDQKVGNFPRSAPHDERWPLEEDVDSDSLGSDYEAEPSGRSDEAQDGGTSERAAETASQKKRAERDKKMRQHLSIRRMVKIGKLFKKYGLDGRPAIIFEAPEAEEDDPPAEKKRSQRVAMPEQECTGVGIEDRAKQELNPVANN